jgi:MFS family permease
MTAAALPPPTRVRYLVVALTMLSAVLLYLDRFCISFAGGYIKEDLGLSNAQVGWMLSAFFWTYALAQVPSGFLSDRFGARLMLTLYILFWSLFTGLTGLAGGFLMLMVLRFGLGLAQAGAYPTAASLLSKWVPFPARALASSLVAWGGRIGGFIAPVLTALVMVLFVPVSVPSVLGPDDILDYPLLCHQLSQPQQVAGLGDRILGHLPGPTRDMIREAGRRYAAALDQSREQGVPLQEVLEQSSALPSESQVQALAEGLNEVIRWREFHQAPYFHGLALPDQAKELLERPRSELSTAEVERLNRLLLEAAYPQAIRKVYVAGWRPVMLTYGLAGVVVAGLFWFWFRDRPDLHPYCNQAEVCLIEDSRPPGTPSPHGKARRVPLGRLCTSGSMWLLCMAALGTNIGWVFLVTWLPRYLDEVHRLPIEQRGWLASIPLLAGWVGMLSGGWATDRLTRAVGLRWGRALPLALSRFLAMGAYLVCLLFDLGPWSATAAFAVVAFATDFGGPAIWAFGQDVGGRYVGSVLGWSNMWGNLGAALSPPLLDWVVGPGRWDLAFLTCAGAFLAAGVCALGVNATVPIAPSEEREG